MQPPVPVGPDKTPPLAEPPLVRTPRSFRSLFSWQRLALAATSLVLVWVLIVVLLASFQRKLVFPGQFRFGNQSLKANATGWDERQLFDVQVPVGDGLTLNGWLALNQPARTDKLENLGSEAWTQLGEAPLVVYFGGNAGTRRFRLYSIGLLSDYVGCNVLIVDYRSFADNPGRPSEEKFVADAITIVDWAQQTYGVPDDRLVLVGESLGGAVATAVAAERCGRDRPPAALILQATFASMTETAGYHYPFLPVGLLLIDRFPSDDRIATVTCPILQFHGEQDIVVPIAHAERLFDCAPDRSATGIEKRLVRLPNTGHNNMLRHAARPVRDATIDFLDAVGLDRGPVRDPKILSDRTGQ